MRTSKFTETQIVSILKQADAGVPVKDICRQAGISTATYYQWKSKYGGLEASELQRVKELEAENAKLKRMYAELALDNAAMKDLIAENCRTGAEARRGEVPGRAAPATGSTRLSLCPPCSIDLVRPAARLNGSRRRDHRRFEPCGRGAPEPRLLEVLPEAASSSSLESQAHVPRVYGHEAQPAP